MQGPLLQRSKWGGSAAYQLGLNAPVKGSPGDSGCQSFKESGDQHLEFQVWDKDQTKDELLGKAALNCRRQRASGRESYGPVKRSCCVFEMGFLLLTEGLQCFFSRKTGLYVLRNPSLYGRGTCSRLLGHTTCNKTG